MKLRDLITLSRRLVTADVVVLRSDYVSHFLASRLDEISEQTLLPIRQRMSGGPLRLVSVQKVLDEVRRSIGREIRLAPVSSEGLSGSVYGYVDNRKDHAVIVYNDRMNLCWTRFTLVKELMHLYSDTASDFLLNEEGMVKADPLVESAMNSRWIANPDKLSSVELDDETTALLMAIEVLIPWTLRGQLSFMRKAGASFYQIAKAFLVPRNFVEYLFETPDGSYSYLSLSNRIHEELE